MLLSAAKGQRPRNYLSCCYSCRISHLAYALSTPTTMLPQFLLFFVGPWSVVVVQLVVRSLPTPEIRGSNPIIGKFYFLSTVLKDENKEKEAWNVLIKKNIIYGCKGRPLLHFVFLFNIRKPKTDPTSAKIV